MKLLGTGNPKTLKGQKQGYMTYILHLAPSTASGYQTCPGATAECARLCLNTSGRGRMASIQNARIRKTRWFFEDRAGFMAQLVKDIQAGIRKADRDGYIPVFRLNGTSDIRWESVKVGDHRNIFEMFPNVQFYDYTKLANRRNIPANYHLTFSRSVDSPLIGEAFDNGMNVAVVFSTAKKDSLPVEWKGTRVVDGDETDLRFLDPTRAVVGLRAKGFAKGAVSDFVVNV